MLVGEIIEGSTLQVRGLDLQLFWQLQQLAPDALTFIGDLNITSGQGLFPYAQPPLKEGLKRFLSGWGQPITINSAYRSIVAQAMLYSMHERGLIGNLVAYPGKSDHQSGACLDIEEWGEVTGTIEDFGFERTYGDADPMHFDYGDGVRDIRPESIRAFQMLWNQANPGSLLEADGDLGDRTLQAIYNSPAEGWPGLPVPRLLRLTTPLQSGDDVGKLQFALRAQGVKLGKADGLFGPATDQAVRDFQSVRGLATDGVVGREVRKLLGLEG